MDIYLEDVKITIHVNEVKQKEIDVLVDHLWLVHELEQMFKK